MGAGRTTAGLVSPPLHLQEKEADGVEEGDGDGSDEVQVLLILRVGLGVERLHCGWEKKDKN